MKPASKDDLVNSLKEFSKAVELDCEVGSAVVTEYGARVLGIFIGEKQNPFWVADNPRENIVRREWNIGGNRIWTSPERSFFYSRPSSFEGWFCQPQLDPGCWSITSSSRTSVVLEQGSEIKNLDNETEVSISLSRRVSSSGIRISRGLDYVRLKVREAMAARGDVGNGVNLWSLTQVHPGRLGGTVLIPVRPKASPVHYLTEIPRSRLRVSKDHVSFKIDGMAMYKLGVMPEDMVNPGSSSILYYVEHRENNVYLVSMKTLMAPVSQDECLDMAKSNPAGPKGCVQSYNSSPDLCFGEMELHFKPAVKIRGVWFSYADYDIEVYAGKRSEVMRVLRKIIPKPILL